MVLFLIGILAAQVANARPTPPLPIVIVDKSTHQIHMAEYTDVKIEIKKSYHVTTGKVAGDKQVEKDLKTPEGIYYYTAKLTPPALKKKFGAMGFLVDYPNFIDRHAGKTGYDIMLHATDDPERLKRDLDSEGCVVVSDDQIKEFAKFIRLHLTPLIIYDVMKPEYLMPKQTVPEVVQAFERWFSAWEGKDLDTYIGSYAPYFSYNRMNVKKYREYKASLNKKYHTIKVNPANVRYYVHPKYSVVSFSQNYESKLKNGKVAFKSSGTKMLYFVKIDGQYKIAAEEFTNLRE